MNPMGRHSDTTEIASELNSFKLPLYQCLLTLGDTKAATHPCDAVVPLVNDVSVILIVQIVGKIRQGARCTKHRHKTRIVAALLHVDNKMHNND